MISAGANMSNMPMRNKVSIDNNTLHVQSRITISTDGDFSEKETIHDTGCGLLFM